MASQVGGERSLSRVLYALRGGLARGRLVRYDAGAFRKGAYSGVAQR